MRWAWIVFVLLVFSGCASHQRLPALHTAYTHEKVPFAASEAMAAEAAGRLARLYPPGRTALQLQKPVLSPEQAKAARERIEAEKAARLERLSAPASPPAKKGKKVRKGKKDAPLPEETAPVALPEPRLFTDAFESALRQAGFRIVTELAGVNTPWVSVSWTIDQLANEPHEPESWYMRLMITDRTSRRIISRVYDSQGLAQGGLAEGTFE